VRSDDILAASTIYPGSGVSDADGDGVADAGDDCPATPGGLAVDADGCACADPGHASCADPFDCTVDACNPATAACTHDAGSCPDTDDDGIADIFDDCAGTAAGLAVDADGCACADPGHASCDDADACTADACDPATGRCTNVPVSCDDGDVCTTDACDPTAGCTHVATGDADADGTCDTQDNCPRSGALAAIDANGDGVGDACECGEANPGACVPPSGRNDRRCFVEWRPAMPLQIVRGVPSRRQRCTDGDPACDRDGVAGQCTVRTLLCVNLEDPRFPTCVPFATERLTVLAPRAGRDAADAANAAALAGALDLGAQTLNYCGAPVDLVIPLHGRRRASENFRVRVRHLTGNADARLRITCTGAR
jgi:hypothetical protein